MSEHVANVLKSKGIYFTFSGKDYVTRCLNPEHDDNNPSFRIDKITGIAHCFSCGFKVNIFKYFGIVDNFTSIKIAKLKEKIQALHISANGVEFPHEKVPFTKSFRNISSKTLKEFGAFYTNKDDKLVDRIFFPVLDLRDKPVVYVGRHMHSSGNPRYINYPSGVTMPIFPEKFKSKFTSAVLVEGIFDMLNLYDKGVKNVCCTFGTNTLFKDTALKLLPLRTQGINKIYLMYDGDEAGRQAMDKLVPVLEECNYTVEKITLEEDSDPGDLSSDDVQSIKEYIDAQNSSN